MARKLILLAALIVAWPLGYASAQSVDQDTLIYGLYRTYVGVEPPADQLQFWKKEMSRGASAADVHANLLGSQAYFDKQQKNNELFVKGAYWEVLNVVPDAKSLDYWVHELVKTHRNDRVKWAKMFLKAARVEIPPGVANPASILPSGDLPSRLATTAQLLQTSSRLECSGQSGWLIQSQTKYLAEYVRLNQQLIKNPGSNPTEFRSFLTQMNKGIQGIQSTLYDSSMRAPTTQQHLDQISQILQSMDVRPSQMPNEFWPSDRPSIGSYPTFRPGVNQLPAYPNYRNDGLITYDEQVKLGRLLDDAIQQLRSTSNQYKRVMENSWTATQLQRDIDSLLSGASALRYKLGSGTQTTEFATEVQKVIDRVHLINDRIRAEVKDVRVLQTWSQSTQSFDTFASSMRPTWDRPAPVKAYAVQDRSADAIAAIDQTIGKCDVLIAAFAPYTYSHPSVLRLEDELRAVKGKLVELRLKVTSTSNLRDLKFYHVAITNSFNGRITPNWRQAVSSGNIRNAPELSGLLSALESVGRSFDY